MFFYASKIVGFFAMVGASLFALYSVYAKVFLARSPVGFTALIWIITFLSGTILVFLGGLFGARLWSVAAVAVIAGLLFPTLLTLFVSPEWKRLGFERYFEMQAGNFVALAGYWILICAILAFGAHFLRRTIGLVVRLVRRRPSDQGKNPE